MNNALKLSGIIACLSIAAYYGYSAYQRMHLHNVFWKNKPGPEDRVYAEKPKPRRSKRD
jgi:hypothetical protein